MRKGKRALAALLAAALVLAIAPFALAFDGAPVQIQQGSAQRLELHKAKGGAWGGTDTSWLYKDFTAASSANEQVAKIYENGGKFYVAGMSVGSTTYSATTAQGETVSGSIVVIGPWPESSGGGSSSSSGGGYVGGGYGGSWAVGGSISTKDNKYIVKPNGTATITGVDEAALRTTFDASPYTWSSSNSNVGYVTVSGTTATFTAVNTGDVIIYARHNVTGKQYSSMFCVVNEGEFAFKQTSLTLKQGNSGTISIVYAHGNVNHSGTWKSDDETVAKVANGTVTAVGVGTTTISYTDTTGGSTGDTKSLTVYVTNQATSSAFTVRVDYTANAEAYVVVQGTSSAVPTDLVFSASGNISVDRYTGKVTRGNYYNSSYGYGYQQTYNPYLPGGYPNYGYGYPNYNYGYTSYSGTVTVSSASAGFSQTVSVNLS